MKKTNYRVAILDRVATYQCLTKITIIMMRRLEFSSLWMQVWDTVAKAEGWPSESDFYEYSFVLIEPIEYDGDCIDGVMFFRDGTVEFHLQEEQDAFCWDLFPIEIIEEVYARINLK